MMLSKWELIKREVSGDINNELDVIHKHANCIGCPTSWFFPEPNVRRMSTQYGSDGYNAYMTCKDCKVQAECFAFAEKHGCVGVWGGWRFTFKGKSKLRLRG